MEEQTCTTTPLLVQVTFDLGDGTFMMVASNVQENRDVCGSMHYRPTADSAAQVITSSKTGGTTSPLPHLLPHHAAPLMDC